MTDDTATGANSDRLALLTAKLERESRATRYVLVICTAALLAVNAYIIRAVYNDLPDVMLAHFMEHMQDLVMTAKTYDAAVSKRAASNK
jgi:hypothetical protein